MTPLSPTPPRRGMPLLELMARARLEAYCQRTRALGLHYANFDDLKNSEYGDLTGDEVSDMQAVLAAIEAAGFVVVPVEPTNEMVMAGGDVVVDFDADFRLPDNHAHATYRAMLAARPQP